MAAGKGTRMKSDIPKPLIPILGKPMIQHLLERVRIAGIDEKPVVVVSPGGLPLFHEALGDQVDFVVQTEQLGTGHALKSAEQICGGADNVMVLYGDHPFLSPPILQMLSGLPSEHPGALVMLTVRVPHFDDAYAGFVSWSRILRDETGRVIGDRQVKDATDEEKKILELNPCMYAFPAPWIWEKLAQLKNVNASKEYYLTDGIAMAMEEGKEIITADADPLEVIGVNSPEELARAEALVAAR